MSLICELARQDALVQDLPAAQDWLSASELQRLDGFNHPQRRASFLAGRRLMRLALARWPGLSQPRLIVDEQGRSHVEDRPDLCLSISHSGAWVACVVADAPLGLDIEDTGRSRDFAALAELVHSPAQCQAIQAAPSAAERARQFYQWWTLKEAWFKRQGLGLDMARMPQLSYEPSPSAGSAVCCLLPHIGLLLALDGPACAHSRLPSELAGMAPVWCRFDYATAR
ncbi:4'-phosphopantetheinyl transferase superfamily protein [Paucibacter sp. AS339]|uniref:4'-phosphopantetheinyl transferase family protein n=1 Tax=Paucibacter hankyongi TaxID=3133434 RepID=UPI0030959796